MFVATADTTLNWMRLESRKNKIDTQLIGWFFSTDKRTTVLLFSRIHMSFDANRQHLSPKCFHFLL